MTDESIFHEALARVNRAERAAFLDGACVDQPELRAAVEALLAAHGASASLLDQPAAGPPATGAYTPGPQEAPPLAVTAAYQPLSVPGMVIAGRYVLVEKIGEGGMGEVWVAKQTEPVKRKVALKLIKAGMDSKAVLGRFEQERQALGMMDHPNIAHVLDGGMTPTGQPFFVMELVNGLPLTKFCDEAMLTLRQRLELFVPICQAVQHAHQKGIVHRDLKPANILVTLIDAKPMPKVIDFGVAKATAGKLTDESMATQFGAVVGTLEYMSPEQAGFSGEDVDTRADVYSLGVILYELLTGLRPIDSKRLRQAALTEMIRIIREEEPSKPSTRLSTDESLPSLAALRSIEPKKLMALLRGELDWVVMKCLEKHRERRYETANGLARDVERYLADEPVEARPPTAGYRLAKFFKRHKGPTLAASLILLALLAGMTGTTWGFIEARSQASRARQEATEKETARQEEAARAEGERLAKEQAQRERNDKERARRHEEQERKYARAIADFVKDDFLALTSVEGQDRFGGTGEMKLDRNATLRQLLDRAAEKLNRRVDLDPRIEAELRWMIGVNYRELGVADLAITYLERCVALRLGVFGPDHDDTLAARNSLALAYDLAGKPDLARPLHLDTLRRMQAVLGHDHPGTLQCMNNLALSYRDAGMRELARPLLEETLKLRRASLGRDHDNTLESMHNLAGALVDAGELGQAIPLLTETLELISAKRGGDHPKTLDSMNGLAMAYVAAGKLELALPLLTEALKLRTAKLGPDHLDTVQSMSNLAGAYRNAGKLDLALPLFETALKLQKAKLGADHPETARGMHNLAGAYGAAGKLHLALPLCEAALTLRKAKLGADHPDTLNSLNMLASGYQSAGQLDLALPLYVEVFTLRKAKLGADHPETLVSMNNLAQGYKAARKMDQALPLLEETLRLRKEMLGADHPDTLVSMNNLASGYQAAGKLDLALPLFAETLKLMQAKLGPNHPKTLTTLNNLAVGYRAAGELDQALPLFVEALSQRKSTLGADHPETLASAFNLAMAHQDLGKLDLALPMYLEAALGMEKLSFQDQHAQPIVGGLANCYELRRQFEQAEPWRRKWLAVIKQRSGADTLPYAGELAALGSNLLEQKRWTDAEAALRECLAICQPKAPDAWTTFNTQSRLGGVLMGQKKYAEAEPMLMAGYEGMKKQTEKSPPPAKILRLREALERLVRLYEALDKADDVAKWRAELATFPAPVSNLSEKK